MLNYQNILFGSLLFIAAAIGWFFGSRRASKIEPPFSQLPRDYFIGLNYLINEQPDHATDVFIKMLEVNSDSVEAHLALGNLFRRKGEVERAIRLHQNLIARPTLDFKQRTEAVLALAYDYMSAGLLDRAEGLFLDLCENTEKKSESLQSLIDIYEQEKDWNKAIDATFRLEKETHVSCGKSIAQYYCELANQALATEDETLTKNYIEKALEVDKDCVRASILQGKFYHHMGCFREAIHAYRRVKNQDPAYLSEVLEDLRYCYEKENALVDFAHFLKECLVAYPGVSVIWMFAKQIRVTEGDPAAEAFLIGQLKQKPSLRGLYYLLELNMKEELILFKDLTQKLIQERPIYRCKDCGFAGKKVYWQCPSCKRWDSVLPIQGLEGE